jgi:hypothetical protein
MELAARILVIGGVTAIIAGGLLYLGARLGLSRIPGDIIIERGNFSFGLLIGTSIVLSIVLTIVLNLVFRLGR